MEHRVIWELTSGRPLRPEEDIHHIDGNPSNNDPVNLIALSRSDHMKLHAAGNEKTSVRKRLAQLKRFEDPKERARHSKRMREVWAACKAR